MLLSFPPQMINHAVITTLLLILIPFHAHIYLFLPIFTTMLHTWRKTPITTVGCVYPPKHGPKWKHWTAIRTCWNLVLP